jgi:hypothetical protein
VDFTDLGPAMTQSAIKAEVEELRERLNMVEFRLKQHENWLFNLEGMIRQLMVKKD